MPQGDHRILTTRASGRNPRGASGNEQQYQDRRNEGYRLTDDEREFLADRSEGIHVEELARKLQVESLFALAWALSLVDSSTSTGDAATKSRAWCPT